MKRQFLFFCVVFITLASVAEAQIRVRSTNSVDMTDTRKAAELICISKFDNYELYDVQSYYDIGGERSCDVYIFSKRGQIHLKKEELIDSIYYYRYRFFAYQDSIIKTRAEYNNSAKSKNQVNKYRENSDKNLRLATKPSEFFTVYTSASENHYPVFEYRYGLPENYVLKYDIEKITHKKLKGDSDILYFGPLNIYVNNEKNDSIINLDNHKKRISKKNISDFRYNLIGPKEDSVRVKTIWAKLKETNIKDISNDIQTKSGTASYTIPDVPYFRQGDWTNIMPQQGSCTVMAGASVLGYYDKLGYWNIVPQAWYEGPATNQNAGFGKYVGYNETKTICGETKTINFGPESFLYYLAYDIGYNFCEGGTTVACLGTYDLQNLYAKYTNTRLGLSFSYNSNCVLGGHSYSTIKSEINNNHPMILGVTNFSWSDSGGPYDYIGGHNVAIVGYDESNSVAGDPIKVYTNGDSNYKEVWWNYAQIRNDNDETTVTVSPGGSPGTWYDAPSTGSPSNNTNVCVGNITFTWQNKGSSAYRVQISSNNNFTNILNDFVVNSTTATVAISNSGTYYWRVMPRNSNYNFCHFNDNTFIFNVIQSPSQPNSISGSTTPCYGTSQTYSVSTVSGATSYSWTLPSGWSGSSTTNSITTTVGSNSGTISVIANNNCGVSIARTLPVTVTSVPAQPGNISGATSVCQGSSQTYSVSAVSGATSYIWTLPSGWSGSSTSNSIIAKAGANSGTISVTANNSCGSSTPRSQSLSVTTVPTQPGSISGATSVCQSSSQTYSITAVSGATSYTWTLPSGWSGSSTSNSITVTVGAGSGIISVTANNACGASTPRTLPVTGTTVPAQPGTITGATSVCQGSSQTYSVPAVSGATSYTWTLPTGWSGSSTSNSITVTVGAGSGNISVTANNVCGSSTPRTQSVTAITIPAQPVSISGSISVCQGSSQTYSVTAVSGASSYTWILPSGWSGSSTTNSITATVGANSGTISVTANNACGSSNARTQNLTVGTPEQPGAISGPTTPCQGSAQTYSITAVSGITSYTWALPSGWNGSSTSNSITVTVGAGSGIISVTANNACGASTSRTLPVTGTTVPAQPGTITGATSVCQGSSQTYSVPAVSGATSYTWTLPTGWSGSSTSNSITVTVGAGSGNISVTANNVCGSSTPRTQSVTAITIPAQPVSISGSISVCQGSSQTYSVTAVSGATSYTWTLPSGWSGSSTTNSITTIVGTNSGTISVTANNACGSSTARTQNLTVGTPEQPGSITGSSSVCQGQESSFCIIGESGIKYIWDFGPGSTIVSGQETYCVVVILQISCIASVTPQNSCGKGTPRFLSISVTSAPAQPSEISGPTTPCQNSSGNVYSATNVPGVTYNWIYSGTGAGITSGQGSNSINVSYSASATSGSWSVVPNNNCGKGLSRAIIINPQAPPSAPITDKVIQPSSTVPTGGAELTGLPANGSWTLKRFPGNIATNGSGTSYTVSGLTAGKYTFTVTSSAGCTSEKSDTVKILPQNLLNVYDSSHNLLKNNDIIKIPQPGEGTFVLTVESLTDWQVEENSLWLSAKKQDENKIEVSYLENISSTDKKTDLTVSNIMNNKLMIQIQQPSLVSVEDNVFFRDLKLYPNPTRNFTYLFTGDKKFDNITVTIFNQAGEIIFIKYYMELPADYIMEIDLGRYDYGIYYLKVSDGNRFRIFKMVHA